MIAFLIHLIYQNRFFLNGDLEDYFQEPKLFIFKSGAGHIAFDLTNSLNTYKFNENYKLIPMKKVWLKYFKMV